MTILVFSPPTGQNISVARSQIWKTYHQEAVSGKDTPLAIWTYPRWRYTLTFNFLRSASAYLELQYVQDFYNRVYGSANVWAYSDGDDNTATAQAFGTGDGTTTDFQLYRSLPGLTFLEPVNYVVGTPLIYRNGVSAAGHFTITNGVVSFTDGAPALGVALTWTGTFDWLVRFDEDNLDFAKMVNNIWELPRVSFTTIKL